MSNNLKINSTDDYDIYIQNKLLCIITREQNKEMAQKDRTEFLWKIKKDKEQAGAELCQAKHSFS